MDEQQARLQVAGQQLQGTEHAAAEALPASGPAAPHSPAKKSDWLHSTAGIITIVLGLLTAVISLIAAILQYITVRPDPPPAEGGNPAASLHASSGHFDYSQLSGGSETSGTGPGQPAGPSDYVYSLTYNSYYFEPGYEVLLPDCGAPISVAESDWPNDMQVMLVWHGNADSPVANIVLRVVALPTDSPADFDSWLNSVCNTLQTDPANKSEGQLAAYQIQGYAWHNLPMSRYNTVAGYQEAIDINMSQFGPEAISVTFYFPVPPADGVLEDLIPQVLGSIVPTPAPVTGTALQ